MTINKWVWLMLAIFTLTIHCPGQTFPSPPSPARAGRENGALPNNLRAAMNDMLDVVFNLKNEAADPADIDLTMKDLATFERDVAICKLHMPPSIGRLTGDDKADEINSYRVMMSNLIRTSLDLEDAVTNKNTDQIKKLLARIDEIESQGHQEFVPP